MLGCQLIEASEEFPGRGWQAHVQREFGMSSRTARRYMAFAAWGSAHPEELAMLLRMRPQPSYLRATEFATIDRLFRRGK
jgi:hypothetical protein